MARLLFLFFLFSLGVLVATCDGEKKAGDNTDNESSDDVAINDPQNGAGSGSGSDSSGTGKIRLPLSFSRSNKVLVAMVLETSGTFKNILNFFPISPAFLPLGIAKTSLLENNQIFEIAMLKTDDGDIGSKWQIYVSFVETQNKQVILNITRTEKELSEIVAQKDAKSTTSYPLETASGSCEVTTYNGSPKFFLKDDLFYLQTENKIEGAGCGAGKKVVTYLFIPDNLSQSEITAQQTRVGYDSKKLYFQFPANPFLQQTQAIIRVWNTDKVINFAFSKNFPIKYRENVKDSVAIFNTFFRKEAVLPKESDVLIAVAEQTEDFNPLDLEQNLFYWNEDITLEHEDPMNAFTTFGAGSIMASATTGRIFRSIISLNAQSFALLAQVVKEFAQSTDVEEKPIFDREMNAIIIHELGHSLGLRHNFHGCLYDLPSIMDYYKPGTSPTELGTYDRIALLYGYNKTFLVDDQLIGYHCNETEVFGEADLDMMRFLKDCKQQVAKYGVEVPGGCRLLEDTAALITPPAWLAGNNFRPVCGWSQGQRQAKKTVGLINSFVIGP